jgi:uncharacterized protein YbjT (DUF2867 family)
MDPGSSTFTAVVAGATGYLGRHVVRTLHETGWRVRALVRDPARLEDAAAAADEVFVGEATHPETLEGLCDGARAAFSSLGIRHVRRRPTVWEVDRDANLNLVREAERAGVDQFVFVSVLHAESMRESVPVAEAREQVVDALRQSPMQETVLRPTGFFNDMEEILEMARRGRVWVPGDGTVRLNPVDGADIADVVREVLWEGPTAPREVEIGGPDVLTMDEIGQLAFAAIGREPRVAHLPTWLLGVAAGCVRPFNTNAYSLMSMFLSLADRGGVAPVRGTRHLADHYKSLAA